MKRKIWQEDIASGVVKVPPDTEIVDVVATMHGVNLICLVPEVANAQHALLERQFVLLRTFDSVPAGAKFLRSVVDPEQDYDGGMVIYHVFELTGEDYEC